MEEQLKQDSIQQREPFAFFMYRTNLPNLGSIDDGPLPIVPRGNGKNIKLKNNEHRNFRMPAP